MYSEYDIRMKKDYEIRGRMALTRRVPVIIRVDGKNFSTFCKRFEKPYDVFLNGSLNAVMHHLCSNIQGAKFAERHSDEISILVTDYDSIQTDAFFDYDTQKIASLTASMATAEFCRRLMAYSHQPEPTDLHNQDSGNYNKKYLDWVEKWPSFDSRCFNIPESEIANYFWWRMLDAKRGSINMTAQANFSHKSLQGLSCDQMQEKLWQEKDINWAKLPQGQKIGFTCRKVSAFREIPEGPMKGQTVKRKVWEIEESPSQKSELDSVLDKIKLIKEESK